MKQWLLSVRSNSMRLVLSLCVAMQLLCTVLCLVTYSQTQQQTKQMLSDYSVQLTEAISSEFRRNNSYLSATVLDSQYRNLFQYSGMDWVNYVSQLQDMYNLCNSQSRFDYYFFTANSSTGQFLETVAVRTSFEKYRAIRTALIQTPANASENGIFRLLSLDDEKRIIYTIWRYGDFLCGCWVDEEVFLRNSLVQDLPVSFTVRIEPGHREDALNVAEADFSISLHPTATARQMRATAIALIQTVLSLTVVIILAYVTNSVNRKLLAPAHELTEILEKYNSDPRQDSRAQWATVIDDATAVLERLGMQVDSLNLKLGEAELEKQKLNLSFRSLQIRPHFLVNSLAMINGMARCGELDQIKAITVRLSDYYRYVLRDITDFVPMELELKHLKNLLDVTEQWNGNTIRSDFQIAPETCSARIPVLLISTFVENSIKHAQSPSGDLAIEVISDVHRGDPDTLCIQILDNGAGFPADFIAGGGIESVDGQHIGISNCIRRLELLYGSKASIHLSNRPSGGASVTISLPWEVAHDASDRG